MVKHAIIEQPPKEEDNPQIQWWLEEGGELLHLMAKNPDGGIRQVFTAYPDGKGYLNQDHGTVVRGLAVDHYGQILLRNYLDPSKPTIKSDK